MTRHRTRVDGLSGTPWTPIELNIEAGNLLPAVEDRRPHLFWPIVEERVEPNQWMPEGASEPGEQATLGSWAKRTPDVTRIAHVYEGAKRYRFTSFYHPYACLFRKELQRAGVDGLLKWSLHRPEPLQLSSREFFEQTYHPNPANVLTPYPVEAVDFSFQGAYSLYNWELFFHAPFRGESGGCDGARAGAGDRESHGEREPDRVPPAAGGRSEPMRRRPAIDLARRALAFEPRVPLRQGLYATIQSFRRALAGLHDRARWGEPALAS